MRKDDPFDPTGLIREAYRIAGITAPECRSILLDWAIGRAAPDDLGAALKGLLARYGADAGHPMTQVLREGLADAPPARRRGGRAGRFSG